MSRTRSSSAITCQNPACQFFQLEDGKDLVKNGKNCARNQQYFCKHCQKYFAETKNTPLYNSRLPREDVEVICKHSVERTSSRGVARVTGHHQETIIRYYLLIGEHAELLNERFQQSLSLGPIELDELWTFVRKNKQCDGPEDRECGDCWTYLTVKSSLGFIIAHFGRKRTEATCTHFLNLVFERPPLPTPSAPIIVATDGNARYREGLAKLYCEPCINYDQVIKQREKNRLVAVIRETISTSVVEGPNNKIRQKISRFGLKTASFTKKIAAYVGALNMFQFMNNFIDAKKGTTPAMREGMTDHAWTWGEFLSHSIQL